MITTGSLNEWRADVAAGTILACYAIATHLGHVRVFLPVRSRGFPWRRGRCLNDSDGRPPR